MQRKDIYTAPEAARVLGLGIKVVHNMTDGGHLKCFRAAGRVRHIPHIELVTFAANHRIPLNFAPNPNPDPATPAGP